MNLAPENGNSCSGESKMTTDIPSAATPIDRDFPGNNLRSRDCGGLQDEERHRSLCGRTNGGDRKNYRLAAATSGSAWGRADLTPGRIRAGCAIQDGRPALTHPPGGIKKCGGAATQPGLDRAERNGTTGRGLGGRRLCAGLTSGTPPWPGRHFPVHASPDGSTRCTSECCNAGRCSRSSDTPRCCTPRCLTLRRPITVARTPARARVLRAAVCGTHRRSTVE